MSKRIPKNLAASVRERLLNRAKNEKRPFNELLQYYAMERFLFRLSKSSFTKDFIEKFLGPIVQALVANANIPSTWIAPGPW